MLELMCLISALVLQWLVATGGWRREHWCYVIRPRADCHSSITAGLHHGHSSAAAMHALVGLTVCPLPT